MQALTKVGQNQITEFVQDEIIYFAIGIQNYDQGNIWNTEKEKWF